MYSHILLLCSTGLGKVQFENTPTQQPPQSPFPSLPTWKSPKRKWKHNPLPGVNDCPTTFPSHLWPPNCGKFGHGPKAHWPRHLLFGHHPFWLSPAVWASLVGIWAVPMPMLVVVTARCPPPNALELFGKRREKIGKTNPKIVKGKCKGEFDVCCWEKGEKKTHQI